jgi:hypothetical protein
MVFFKGIFRNPHLVIFRPAGEKCE